MELKEREGLFDMSEPKTEPPPRPPETDPMPDDFLTYPRTSARRAAETRQAKKNIASETSRADTRPDHVRFPQMFGEDGHVLDEPLRQMAMDQDAKSFWSENRSEREKVRAEGDAAWSDFVEKVGMAALYEGSYHIGRCLDCKTRRDSFRKVR